MWWGATLVNPPPPPPAALQLVLLPEAEDLAAAQALDGRTGFPVPTWCSRPRDSSAPSRTVRSAATGAVDVGIVPAGEYLVEASRWLSAAERAQLPAGQDVTGWVLRPGSHGAGGDGPRPMAVPASHRRSLVISEWAFNVGEQPGLGDYQYGALRALQQYRFDGLSRWHGPRPRDELGLRLSELPVHSGQPAAARSLAADGGVEDVPTTSRNLAIAWTCPSNVGAGRSGQQSRCVIRPTWFAPSPDPEGPTHRSPLTAHRLLLTAHRSLLTPHFSLLTIKCPGC